MSEPRTPYVVDDQPPHLVPVAAADEGDLTWQGGIVPRRLWPISMERLSAIRAFLEADDPDFYEPTKASARADYETKWELLEALEALMGYSG